MARQTLPDLHQWIAKLRQEQLRIDQAIAALIRLEDSSPPDPEQPATAPGLRSRRGRKSMGPEERRQVSERMKDFWRKRQEQENRVQ